MNPSQIIAENLKRLRMERNLSLGQLAELSDVSKVMLSQIEKGDTNPTINTLWKICHGLKVPYTGLLEQSQPHASVLKREDILEQIDEEGHYRLYCYYSNTPTRNFEIFNIELDPGYHHNSIGHSDRSQEYVMVQEGELKLVVGENAYQLKPGDAISFDAALNHVYYAVGEITLKAFMINYYPV